MTIILFIDVILKCFAKCFLKNGGFIDDNGNLMESAADNVTNKEMKDQVKLSK